MYPAAQPFENLSVLTITNGSHWTVGELGLKKKPTGLAFPPGLPSHIYFMK